MAPKTGTQTPTLYATAAAYPAPNYVTADATHVYWTETGPTGTPGAVRRCPIAGCAESGPEALVEQLTGRLRGIITDDTAIYFAEENTIKKLAK